MKKRVVALFISLLVVLSLFWFGRRIPHATRDAQDSRSDATAEQTGPGSPPVPGTPKPADAAIETSYQRSRLEQLRSIAQKSNRPIQFFGLVLDQDNNPIPDVRVTLEIRVAKEVTPGVIDDLFDTSVLTTGRDGRFSLTDARGALLGVKALEKAGYVPSEKAFRKSYWYWRDTSHVFHPNAEHPEVFRMWKQAGAERLVRNGIGHAIPYNGSGTNFDLINGKAVAGAGDMRVTLVRNPQQIQWGQRNYEWTATIEVPNGGVIESDDEQMYQAPSDGYRPKCVIHMAADDANWTDSKNAAIYLKLRGGQYYGRAELKFMVGSDRAVTPFSITAFVNPSGSRNLEYDPLQDVVPSARPQATTPKQ